MVKVLLVYEDFNELVLTESYLKKVGFDVVGVTNEVLLHDQVLSFNPDVIVANGKSSRVSSLSVGQKMKDNQRYQGKVIIVVPKDVRPSPQEILRIKMDGIIEAPIQPEKLIQVLCRVSTQDSALFLEKLQKARLSDPELQKLIKVSNSNASAAGEVTSAEDPAQSSEPMAEVSTLGIRIQDPERMKKYAKFASELEVDMKQSTHNRKELKDRQKDLKKDLDFDTLEDQDELRRHFAEALFKKK